MSSGGAFRLRAADSRELTRRRLHRRVECWGAAFVSRGDYGERGPSRGRRPGAPTPLKR